MPFATWLKRHILREGNSLVSEEREKESIERKCERDRERRERASLWIHRWGRERETE